MKNNKELIRQIAILCVMVLVCNILSVIPSQNVEAKKLKDMYTVIILNNSGESGFESNGELIYTAQTATEQVKKGAIQLLNVFTKAQQSTGGKIHIAVITYDGRVKYVTKSGKFTTDYSYAKNRIEKIKTGQKNSNNMDKALQTAEKLLQKAPEDSVKNTILFTNGMVNSGKYSYTGRYDEDTVGSSWFKASTGINLYAYANTAYESAEQLKKQGKIYTIGFFDAFEDMPEEGKDIKDFFVLTAKDIASSKRFLSVTKAKKITSNFKKLGKKIVKEWQNS